VSEDQLDRLQQEEDARRYFETGHADLQELQKLRTANREDDENPTGYGNGLDREPSSHPATGSAVRTPKTTAVSNGPMVTRSITIAEAANSTTLLI
jgi:hypothetical protein